MHGIHKLKEMLCDELNEYGEKGNMNAQTLDVVDKLAHTVKNLDRIIETADGGYSERGSYRSYDNGGAYRSYDGGGAYRGSYDGGSYDGGGSYRRSMRRDSMGRYAGDGYSARRGGYSRADGREDMIAELEGLKGDAPNDMVRQRIDQLISDLQNE